MVQVSLLVNVVVLIPVLVGLWINTPRMAEAFGPDAPARRVLAAVYLAIAGLSALLLVLPTGWQLAVVPGMFAVQIFYKLLTVPMLGLRHAVVVANMCVVVVHAVTVWTMA